MDHKLSYYDTAKATKSSKTYSIQKFMNAIKTGEWQQIVMKARKLKGTALSEFKRNHVPAVTISGRFGDGRSNSDLIRHSDFIAIDVDAADNVDVQKRKRQLRDDPYVAGYFTSIGGEGLCILFKIKGSTHHYAYENIAEYLKEKYNLIADPSCKNVSRIRFVSWDPERYWHFQKLRFDAPEPKPKDAPVTDDYDLHDIVELVETAERKGKDLMKGYQAWYRIGQALAIFGEEGRELFHRLSRVNKREYNKAIADKQYDNCLDQESKGMRDVRVSPGTIFYIAKQNGVKLKPAPTYVSTRRNS